MINYLVCEQLMTIKGSGICTFIEDHTRMLAKYDEVRVVIIKNNYEGRPIYDLECEVTMVDESDLPGLDGLWYVHTAKESLTLSALKIHHTFQLHNGDLFLTDKLCKLRKVLQIREESQIQHELNIMRLPWVTVNVQTERLKSILESHGIKTTLRRHPVYRQKIEAEPYFDLCITGGLHPIKGLSLPLRHLEKLSGKKIAIISAVPTGLPASTTIDDFYRKKFNKLGIPASYGDNQVTWFLGTSRDQVNEILAHSKRVLHPSFIECYPTIVVEASQYTTVMVNQYANYVDNIDIPFTVVNVCEPESWFVTPTEPALNLDEFNKIGEEQWKVSIMKNSQ